MIRLWMKYGWIIFLSCYVCVPSINCSQIPSLAEITLKSLAVPASVDYLVEHSITNLPADVKAQLAKDIVKYHPIKSFLFKLIDVKDSRTNQFKLKKFHLEGMDGAERHCECNVEFLRGPGFGLVFKAGELLMRKGRSLRLIQKNVTRIHCHDTTDQFLVLAMKCPRHDLFKTFDRNGKIIVRADCFMPPISIKIINNSACIAVSQNGYIAIYDIKSWQRLYECNANSIILSVTFDNGLVSLLTFNELIDADFREIQQLNAIVDALSFESALCVAYIMNRLRMSEAESISINDFPHLEPLIELLPVEIRNLLIRSKTILNFYR